MLSSDDWGWKTSKYQLATRFARSNRVLFVSSIGFRAPTASRSDLKRAVHKLFQFFRGPRQVHENLWVLTPVVIPFGSGRFIRWLNRFLFGIQYGLAIRWLHLSDAYMFVFSPNWAPYLDALRYEKLIYYCVDEHSGFRGVDSSRFMEWDERLTTSADHVFCSADALYQKKRRHNQNTHYMPHGVNWTHFSRAVNGSQLKPEPTLEGIPGPLLLFFGHISYDWVDTGLVRYIAANRPEWHLALAGRSSVAADEFAGHGNILLLGERDYEELPSLCRYADVGIIPFVDSELTAACNPLKLYEYLAAGLAVVSTDIPEVRRLSGAVYIGGSHEAFLAACDEALRIDRSRNAPLVSELVRQHDWDQRVEQIYAVMAA